MKPALDSEAIVQAWEEGQPQHPIDRALTLLSLSRPDATRNDLAKLPIGRRDTLLIEMREHVFGRELHLFAVCPACEEELELELETNQLLAQSRARPEDREPVYRADWEEWSVEFSLPSSLDLAFALRGRTHGTGAESAAYGALMARCIRNLERGGNKVGGAPVSEMPQLLLKQIEAAIAEADPDAEILLNLSCPECGEEFQELFDIVTFLWDEFAAYAKELVYEVHALARYYGWSEGDIFAMSPGRRQTYLGMIR
jgi:hypothetical protein